MVFALWMIKHGIQTYIEEGILIIFRGQNIVETLEWTLLTWAC